MRIPKYLSPSAQFKWEDSQEEYYLQYLADKRPPRFPQTKPMAVGSSFDAYVKSYFHEELFGKNNNPEFEFSTIFEAQVEKQNRDWALDAGLHAFTAYRISGSLADLLLQLKAAKVDPRFEFTIQQTIRGVPLLGKPDVYFIHKDGTPIILDFKVNGFCGKHNTSPKPGYLQIRDGWVGVPSRGANQMHKDCQPMKVNGVMINAATFLEHVNAQWATQLATYGWLCGAELGSEFVTALDQLCCKPDQPDKPKIRIAEHRCLISREYQFKIIARYSELWEIINSNHIFRDMSFEESAARCEILNKQHAAFSDSDSDFIKEMTGRG